VAIGREVMPWVAIGVAVALLHALLLHRALITAMERDMHRASRDVARGLPFRLLMVSPALVGAALSGMWACLGLVAGMVFGRMATWWHTARQLAPASDMTVDQD
jgi:hypothetical protein